ncbi:MAG: hypothetical protein QM495_11680 [Lutibacter sp.]|uniref:hypothetical protein n=1 Tax=Lutibacter sp. TaxID=1925666 RepID=UPI00385A976D
MKLNISLVFLIVCFSCFISCQSEISEIIQSNQGEVLSQNSAVTLLVKNTVTKDGSKDNIIDNASCISVQLPVTVIVNGNEIKINTEEDYEAIEAIFDAFDNDDDNLQIVFPIEIILSDFAKVSIANYDDLNTYTLFCSGNNEKDDDIECIDFKYPINLSVFNSENQITQTVTIANDEQFYNAIAAIDDSQIIEIQFPITTILFDGTEKIINDMVTLQNTMEKADNMCDEDDDNDYNDDDCLDCTIDETSTLLKTCRWKINEIKTNGIENNEQYKDYEFTFSDNGKVKVENDDNEFEGSWSIFTFNSQIVVQINFTDHPDFSFNWILSEIEDDNEINLQFENNELELEKDCD